MTAITERDLVTPFAKARREQEQQVLEMFKSTAAEFIGKQGFSPHRVYSAIADKFGITASGVISILKRYGEFHHSAKLREMFASN